MVDHKRFILNNQVQLYLDEKHTVQQKKVNCTEEETMVYSLGNE